MAINCPKCGYLFNFEEKSEELDAAPEFSSKKLYVSAEDGLRLRSSPEIKPDNILVNLLYGQEVIVKQEKEKWFEVSVDDKTGWVFSYYLIEEVSVKQSAELQSKETSQDNFPFFKSQVQNLTNDLNTIKVRKIIKDEFGGGARGDDLQCTEYVQYKIQQMGISIKWPQERPRHGGRWAGIFERSGQYKVLSEPKAGCAMSFTGGLKNSNVGHVAFVEEVYQDNSIRISEANWPPPGTYFERILTKSQWQDKYKGKFIDFF